MFKVSFKYSEFPETVLFKLFKSKEEADTFIQSIGDRFISIKQI